MIVLAASSEVALVVSIAACRQVAATNLCIGYTCDESKARRNIRHLQPILPGRDKDLSCWAHKLSFEQGDHPISIRPLLPNLIVLVSRTSTSAMMVA